MNIFDIILLKYPDIQRVTYWHTQYDGTPWRDPYEGLIWENTEISKPTKEELKQWAIELDSVYQEKLVLEQRKAAYPAIQDQLDMLYHDKVNNTNTWVDAITAVKVIYPKPTAVKAGK